MALISTDVNGMSLPDLQVGLVRNLEERHDLLKACPSRVTDRLFISYNMELSGGSAVFHAETASLTPSDVKPKNVIRPLEHLTAPFQISRKATDLGSSETDQFKAQTASQTRVLGRKLAAGLITGDGTSNTPYGLAASVTTARTTTLGGALTREALDKFIDKNQFFGSNWAFVGNADAHAKFNTVLTGGYIVNGYETLAGETLNVPTYRGIPFLVESSVATVSGSTDIYMVNLDPMEGFSLWYGLVRQDVNLLGTDGPIGIIDMMYQGTQLIKTYACTTYVQTQLSSDQALAKLADIDA